MEPSDTLYYTAWLMTQDKKFLREHGPAGFKPFPKGPLSYLVALALELHSPLSKSIVYSTVETDPANLRRHGVEADLVCEVYEILNSTYAIDEESLPVMREHCADWIIQRALKVGTQQAITLLDQGDLERARSVLEIAQYRREEEEPALSLFSAGDAIIQKRWKSSDAIPTGFYELDRAWHGGVRPGDLGLVIGPTGTGKSMVMSMFAAKAFWNNKHALYYTTELSKEQVLERIITGIMLKGKSFLNPKVSFLDQLIKAMKEQGEMLGEHSNIEVRDGSLPINALPREMKNFKEEHGYAPDLLLLDDPADMLPPGKFEKSYEGFRNSWTYLRMAIAKEFGIPVWCVGQATREAVDKARSSLKNIGDAFAKGQKSHYVLGLAQTPEQREDLDGNTMSLFVLKDSLHGTTGASMLLSPHWGNGGNGYPMADVLKSNGLNFLDLEPDDE